MKRGRWPLGGASLVTAVALAAWSAGCRSSVNGAEGLRTWHVDAATPSPGPGDASRPFSRITDALAVAGPGDAVVIAPGIYREAIASVRGGHLGRPIVLRAANDARRPVVTVPGRVVTITHPAIELDGLILDGQYGSDDAVRVSDAATGLTMRRVEVRRSGRDCIDMGSPSDVVLDQVLIHHCLDARGGRTDAHGVAAGAVQRLTIRNAEIHTFSGDGLQVDPGRRRPGWTAVTVEASRIWLGRLPEPANGFAAGVVPGENAVDTKTPPAGDRARLTVTDVEAWGFEGGSIANMAAFNLKERVDATLDRVTVHHTEVAFRVRGPADAGAAVDLSNVVVHHVKTAVRYEDDIAAVRLRHMTVGREVARVFQGASAPAAHPEVDALLLLGTTLPDEARGRGMAVGPAAFRCAGADDYRLAQGSPAIDAAAGPATVAHDRRGVVRPQGRQRDLGAYEWCDDCPGPGLPDSSAVACLP